MQYFKITPEDLHAALSEALSHGADYADIYLEHCRSLSISLQNGIVSSATHNIDAGAGIRAVKGAQTGYAYTEEFTADAIRQAARQASRIVSLTPQCEALPLHLRTTDYRYYQPGHIEIVQEEIARLVDHLDRLRNYMLQQESRLSSISAHIIHTTQQVAVACSSGELVEEQRPLTSVSLQCVIQEGSQRERANGSRSYRRSLDMIDDTLLHELADQCIKQARFALSALQPQGGEMQVVLGAGASGILLHEAIGHAFEADAIRRGESIFTDQMGKQICMKGIHIVDDGTLPEMRGSRHFDDEAVETQCTPLVTDGILTSFLHDRISARHFGVDPTGNGMRESFRRPPIPRMRNTYMLGMPGTSHEDLIASVRRGIFVDTFLNGQVQIGAGDYTFYVKSGYLIEGGRLTQPIKDVNIIGNGPQTLSDIIGVADNAIVDPSTWMCGKGGQSCPVSCGMPSVLVNKLTVG